MSNENLISVKTRLAEKYERLANVAGSAAKKQRFTFRATRFRRQIIALKTK
jgi:hypothetical protein